jgi:membrane protease YdiL (CAAX protease family)
VRALWKTYVTDVREHTDGEIRDGTDRRAVIVLLTATVCLLLIRFLGMSSRASWAWNALDAIGLDGAADSLRAALTTSPNARINGRVFWAAARLVGYVVIPLLVIRFVLRDRLADYGVRIRGTLKYWKIYALLLAIILPIAVLASYSAAFQAKYPFYKMAQGEPLWPWFWAWEVLYALQFASLEFFFRGFMLHGLAPRFGYVAVFMMILPYMMIHFTKPMPEAIGSIVAGFVLGTLALKSGSIWWGALAHVTVAVTMDLLSLWHRGFL